MNDFRLRVLFCCYFLGVEQVSAQEGPGYTLTTQDKTEEAEAVKMQDTSTTDRQNPRFDKVNRTFGLVFVGIGGVGLLTSAITWNRWQNTGEITQHMLYLNHAAVIVGAMGMSLGSVGILKDQKSLIVAKEVPQKDEEAELRKEEAELKEEKDKDFWDDVLKEENEGDTGDD